MPQTSGLTVRQHERVSLNLGAEFVIGDEMRSQVRFSPSAGTPNDSSLRASVLDISPGGMGLMVSNFIPRMCRGTVRLYSVTPSSTGALGEPVYEPIFEHKVQVRRVYMASHDPKYVLGVSFLDGAPDLADRIAEVLIAAQSQVADPGAKPLEDPGTSTSTSTSAKARHRITGSMPAPLVCQSRA